MTVDLQLTTFGIDGDRERVADLDTDTLVERLDSAATNDGWWWLDITGPPEAIVDKLAGYFGFDRLMLDDLVEPQGPRYDEHEHGYTVVVHALAADPVTLRTVEVDIVVGDTWLLTFHAEPVVSIDHVRDRSQRSKFRADSPLHLTARLIEFIGERYLPILDLVDEQLLDLEDGAIDGDPGVLHDVHALRRDIAVLRRTLGPQRRMLELMSVQVFSRNGTAAREFQDAVDHHVRLVDGTDSAHALVAALVDTYRSAAAERTNEVITTLTVLSAIFMPLTLIAGIYGMNFDRMPELRQPWGYGAALGLMAAIAIGMWIYFTKRGLIGRPKLRDVAAPARAAGRIGRGLASAATLPVRVPARKLGATVRKTSRGPGA